MPKRLRVENIVACIGVAFRNDRGPKIRLQVAPNKRMQLTDA